MITRSHETEHCVEQKSYRDVLLSMYDVYMYLFMYCIMYVCMYVLYVCV